MLAEWLVLHNNISQELNNKINVMGNYFKGNQLLMAKGNQLQSVQGNQLQPVIMTKILKYFTPIVHKLPTIPPTYFNSTFLPQQQLDPDHYPAPNNIGS